MYQNPVCFPSPIVRFLVVVRCADNLEPLCKRIAQGPPAAIPSLLLVFLAYVVSFFPFFSLFGFLRPLQIFYACFSCKTCWSNLFRRHSPKGYGSPAPPTNDLWEGGKVLPLLSCVVHF